VGTQAFLILSGQTHPDHMCAFLTIPGTLYCIEHGTGPTDRQAGINSVSIRPISSWILLIPFG
jgi:hypothetical protein